MVFWLNECCWVTTAQKDIKIFAFNTTLSYIQNFHSENSAGARQSGSIKIRIFTSLPSVTRCDTRGAGGVTRDT